jgi:hypothetical protein
MFGPSDAVRAEFFEAKKHIICAFCGSELSLRNNAKQYVDRDYLTHPHVHPTGLHPFMARILAESLWVWEWPVQQQQQQQQQQQPLELQQQQQQQQQNEDE